MQLKLRAVGGDQACERSLVAALGPSQQEGIIASSAAAGTVLTVPAGLIWG
jgi:hypothetical protein